MLIWEEKWDFWGDFLTDVEKSVTKYVERGRIGLADDVVEITT